MQSTITTGAVTTAGFVVLSPILPSHCLSAPTHDAEEIYFLAQVGGIDNFLIPPQ